jgi:hypothetical protein
LLLAALSTYSNTFDFDLFNTLFVLVYFYKF